MSVSGATSFDSTLAKLGVKTTASTSGTPVANKGTGTLGQADFLKLMTAQMKNQDPTNPTDNTQMIAQMAQFSSVAGIAEMNTTLKAMAVKLNGTSAADALAYVGKTVLAPGTTAYPRTSGGFAGSVEIGGGATSIDISIADASGNVVHQGELGAHEAGTVAYDWDGKDAAGNAIGGAPFTVTVTASNAGTAVEAQNLVWAPVESVALSGGDAVLNVPGLGPVKIPAVRQVG